MRIALASLWAIILTIGIWVYLARAKVQKEESFSGKVKAVLNCRKIIKIYTACACVALLFLAIWQESVYDFRSFIFNLKYVTLIGILIPLAYEDFFTRRISNKVILAGLALRAVFYVLEAIFCTETFLHTFKQSLMGFLVGVAVLILTCFIIRNGIGMGDVKLLMLMGLFQGLYPVMTSIAFSLVVSFFVAVVLLIRKSKGRKDTLPFAPSILVGTFLSIILTTPTIV